MQLSTSPCFKTLTLFFYFPRLSSETTTAQLIHSLSQVQTSAIYHRFHFISFQTSHVPPFLLHLTASAHVSKHVLCFGVSFFAELCKRRSSHHVVRVKGLVDFLRERTYVSAGVN